MLLSCDWLPVSCTWVNGLVTLEGATLITFWYTTGPPVGCGAARAAVLFAGLGTCTMTLTFCLVVTTLELRLADVVAAFLPGPAFFLVFLALSGIVTQGV